MDFISRLFLKPPYPAELKPEVERLIEELKVIGAKEDFLSERPGAGYNAHCRHIRTREIGKRFDEIGGLPMMEMAHYQVNKKLGKNLADHLEYAWVEIGAWLP